MYARIINNNPIWPYSLDRLRQDESGTSFPDQIPEEYLESYNIFRVAIDDKPQTTHLEDAVLQDPVCENGQWVQHWQIVPLGAEAAQEKMERLASDVRIKRDQLLQETDWTQFKDIPDSTSIIWQSYRQLLRDVPQQPGFPHDVIWPVKPG